MQPVERRGEIAGRAQHRLTLAVVALTRRLQHRRQPKASHRAPRVRAANAPAAQGAVAMPTPLTKDFSAIRSWLTRSTAGAGRTGLSEASKSSPSALTFSNSKLMTSTAAANARNDPGSRVIADRDRMRHLGGRAVALAGQDMTAIAKAGSGHRRHTAKLTTADEPDRRVGWQRKARHEIPPLGDAALAATSASGDSATDAVCAARNASRRRANAGVACGQDRRREQSGVDCARRGRSPMCQPECPPASGRSTTGCPCPSGRAISIGTPSTGNARPRAHMPGRCAAPPAPAMMTRRPRSRALLAYSRSRSGVRCAETIRVSCGTPSASGCPRHG